MAEVNKKLTKEELEEDQFLIHLMNAVSYVQDRLGIFLGGLGVLIVAVLSINFYQQSRQDAELDAASLLGEALIADQNGQTEEMIRMVKLLVETDSYAGTAEAGKGQVFLANRLYAQGQYAEAQSHYTAYLSNYGDIDVLVYAASNGLAACFEAQGQLLKAAEKYREYAQKNPNKMEAAASLFEAARCYGLNGQTDIQLEILGQITSDFPKSPVAALARQQKEML